MSQPLTPVGRDVWMTTVVAETVVPGAIVQLAANEPVWVTETRPGIGVTKVATGAGVAAAARERPPKPDTRNRTVSETSGESRRRLMASDPSSFVVHQGTTGKTRFPQSTLGQLAPAVNPVEGPVPGPVLYYQPD